MGYRQRAVWTNGWSSYLLPGDPERSDERFYTNEDGARLGRALVVLLAEGWSVVSVTPLRRQAKSEEDFGCTMILLAKEM
jgi:hypothetical protein